MKKTSFLMLITFLTLSGVNCFLYPGETVTLNELANPYMIEVDDDQFFIAEGASIFIYSLKDYGFIKKFGNAGEGPGEFKVNPHVNLGSVQFDVYPDYIVVYSMGRISYFTKQGEFIKEKQLTSSARYYKPIDKGKRFVGMSTTLVDNIYYGTVNLYDQDLKLEKELHREKYWFTPGRDFDLFAALRGIVIHVSGEIIFFENEKTSILVFNDKGKQIDTFTPPIKPVKMTSEKRSELINMLQTSSRFKSFYERFQSQIKIGSYHPLIRSFFPANQKVYAVSWRKKQGYSECFIYDLKKKTAAKIYLPLKEVNAILLYPYTIEKDKLYQLVDNDKNEKWELHIEDMKSISIK